MYVKERFRVGNVQHHNRHSIAIAFACFAIQCLMVTASVAQQRRPLDPLAHQLQPDRLVVYKTVAGRAAGGRVATGTAFFDGMDEESDPQGVSSLPNAMVLYYPVIDTSADGYGQKKIGDDWRQISPMHNVKPGLPPTIVFHGTGDTVTPYTGAKSFHQKMQSAGNDCELISHEDGVHGYLIFELPLFESAMRRTQTFLQEKAMLPASEVSKEPPTSARQP